MSDNRLRPAFKTEDGLPKCIDLLHSCLDDKDWNLACLGMSNFAMGTILGKGFPQAQVHTVHSTSAC